MKRAHTDVSPDAVDCAQDIQPEQNLDASLGACAAISGQRTVGSCSANSTVQEPTATELTDNTQKLALARQLLAQYETTLAALPKPRVPHLLVKSLHPQAKKPKRESCGAAGYDLTSVEDMEVPARGIARVCTGIALALPEGHYGRIAPRSGLAFKHAIDVLAGVIDLDYRGELCVILVNHRDTTFVVNQGDRIAQLVIERIATPDVEWADELPASKRGLDGFGSTGVGAPTS